MDHWIVLKFMPTPLIMIVYSFSYLTLAVTTLNFFPRLICLHCNSETPLSAPTKPNLPSQHEVPLSCRLFYPGGSLLSETTLPLNHLCFFSTNSVVASCLRAIYANITSPPISTSLFQFQIHITHVGCHHCLSLPLTHCFATI